MPPPSLHSGHTFARSLLPYRAGYKPTAHPALLYAELMVPSLGIMAIASMQCWPDIHLFRTDTLNAVSFRHIERCI